VAVLEIKFAPRCVYLDGERLPLSPAAWAVVAFVAVSDRPFHASQWLARDLFPESGPEALDEALAEIQAFPPLRELVGIDDLGRACLLHSGATIHTPMSRVLEMEDRLLARGDDADSSHRKRQYLSALLEAAERTIPKSERGEAWIDAAHARLDELSRRAIQRASGLSPEESALAAGLLLDAQRGNFLGLDVASRPRPRFLLGRDAEIAGLRDLLADPSFSLVTLVGELGVGKTALATEMLEMLPSALSTRRIYTVRLRNVGSYPVLMDHLAEGLRLGIVATLPGLVDREALVIGRATGSVLLLDNAEGLDDKAVALLSRLLKQSGARVLCTSRRKLGIVGEIVFPVRPLPVPTLADARQSAPLASRFASAALFQTWRIEGKGLAPLPPQQLQRVLLRTEGVPEAIHQAAMSMKPGEEVVQSVQEALQALGGEDRSLLRCVALFQSAFPPRAAETVSGIDDAHARLERLAESGLVLSIQGRLYRLPSIVRESEQNRAEYAETWANDAWGRFFDALLIEAGEIDPKDAPAVLRLLLDGEAAIAHLIRAEEGERAASLAVALTPPACIAGMLGQMERLLREVAKASLPPAFRAEIDDALGRVLFSSASYQDAARFSESALRFWREAGDAVKAARSAGNLGIAHHRLGDLRAAIAFQEEAIEGFRKAKDLPRLGAALANLAGAALEIIDPRKAKAAYLEGAKVTKALGSEAEALRLLGVVEACLLEGDGREARERLGLLAPMLPASQPGRRARALLLWGLASYERDDRAAGAVRVGRRWHVASGVGTSLCSAIERRIGAAFGMEDGSAAALGSLVEIDSTFDAIFPCGT
jgi:tetratricopeptide (TPR) repeat protein